MKKKIIFFLSTLILTAVLSGSALASGDNAPGLSAPTGAAAPSACRQGKDKFDEEKAKAFVDELVANQIIPQETGDKLLAHFGQKREEHKAARDKIRSMTEDERNAYFKEQKAKRDADGPFAELVKDKTLTKAQADAIAKALREYRKQ